MFYIKIKKNNLGLNFYPSKTSIEHFEFVSCNCIQQGNNNTSLQNFFVEKYPPALFCMTHEELGDIPHIESGP